VVGPPPSFHGGTEVINNKAGIYIHPVYQSNSRRTAEDEFTSGQCPRQRSGEQAAPKAEVGMADLPDLNWRAGCPPPPASRQPNSASGSTTLRHTLLSLPPFTHLGHMNFGFRVIWKVNLLEYFGGRRIIFFSFQCHT